MQRREEHSVVMAENWAWGRDRFDLLREGSRYKTGNIAAEWPDVCDGRDQNKTIGQKEEQHIWRSL